MRHLIAAWRWLRRQEVRFYLWEAGFHRRNLEAGGFEHLLPQARADEQYRVVQLATLEPPLRQHYSPPWRHADRVRAVFAIAAAAVTGWLAAQGG